MRWLPLLISCGLLQAACTEQVGSPDDHCLEVALTGTQGGPPVVNGLAGPGTLVRYGTIDNHCSDLLLQFDAGRGTTQQLSELGTSPIQLDAIFLTHMHSDHTEGLSGLLLYRWQYLGDPVDIVCSADEIAKMPPPERTMSCSGLVQHTADAMIHSGEIAQRYAENQNRNPAGPAALVRLNAVGMPSPKQPPSLVWKSGDVSVSAIGTTHIAGSLAFRVDTPVGSVVIGGDAGNSKSAPPRESSVSQAVEALAKDADVLVHSVVHPVFAPGAGSEFPPPVYYRQSNAGDLGAMAQRAGVSTLVLTHLIPALDAPNHGPFAIPGGALGSDDFESAAEDGGFTGTIYVGRDLLSVRLP